MLIIDIFCIVVKSFYYCYFIIL